MSDNKAKVTKIYKRLREEWRAFEAKQNAALEEIGVLLEGGIGVGEKMEHVEREFAAAWQAEYHGKYIFDYKVDRAQLKRLFNEGLTHEEIGFRAWNFLRDKEPGLVKARHPFLWFVKGINRYADNGAAAPADCRHDPKCRTDAQCTARRAGAIA